MEELIRIEIFNMHEDFYVEGTKVVSCHIFYPQFITNSKSMEVINERYYKNALKKKEYCTRVMYPSAVQSYMQGSRALPYQMIVTITLTYDVDGLISFYQDEYLYTGGANGTTTRVGQTIDVTTGSIMHLSDFMQDKDHYEECIKQTVIQQIINSHNPTIYFDDFPALVKETFHPKNYYLTCEGIVIFFALYDIAPHSTGIPTFTIPYGHC